MIDVLTRRGEEIGRHTQSGRPCRDGGRERSDAALCRGTPGATKLEDARTDRPLESSEGAQPGRHLDFGLLVSRTVREQISVVLSHPICGHFCYSGPGKLVHWVCNIGRQDIP